MSAPSELFGTVVREEGGFFVVEAETEIPHLKIHNLRRPQMGRAKVGDDVKIRYFVTATMSLWSVVEVL